MGQQSKQSQPPAPQYGGGSYGSGGGSAPQAQNLGQGWGGGYHYFTPQVGYQGVQGQQNYGPQLGYGAPTQQSWGYQGPSTLGFTTNWQPGGASHTGMTQQPPQQPGMAQLPGPLYGQAAPTAPQMPSTPSSPNYSAQLQQAAQKSYQQSGSQMPFDQYMKEYVAQRGVYTPYQQGQNAYGYEDVLAAREKAIAQSRAAQARANAGGGITPAAGADAYNQALRQNEHLGDAERGGIFSVGDLSDMDKMWLYANQYKGGNFGEQGGENLGMSAAFKTTDDWRRAINDVGNTDLVGQIVGKQRSGELDKYDSPFVRKYKVYMGLANPQDYAQQQVQTPGTQIANTGTYGAPPTNPGVPPVAQPAVIPAAQLPWTKGTQPPAANGPEAALGPRPTRQWRGWGSGGPTGLRAQGTMTNAAGGM